MHPNAHSSNREIRWLGVLSLVVVVVFLLTGVDPRGVNVNRLGQIYTQHTDSPQTAHSVHGRTIRHQLVIGVTDAAVDSPECALLITAYTPK